MAKCKQCGKELELLDDGRYKCESCGLVYAVRKVTSQNTGTPSPQAVPSAVGQQAAMQSYGDNLAFRPQQSQCSTPPVPTYSSGQNLGHKESAQNVAVMQPYGDNLAFRSQQSPQSDTPPVPTYSAEQNYENKGNAQSISGQEMPVKPSKVKWLMGLLLSVFYVFGKIAQLFLNRYLTSLSENEDVYLRFMEKFGEKADFIFQDLIFVNSVALPLLVNAFLICGLILLVLCAANSKYKLALGILAIHPFSKFILAASGLSTLLEQLGSEGQALFFFESLDLGTPILVIAAAALLAAGLQEVYKKANSNNLIPKGKKHCSFARGAAVVLILFGVVSIARLIAVNYLPIALDKIDIVRDAYESSELYESALQKAEKTAELPSKILEYAEMGLYYLGILWTAVMIRPRTKKLKKSD